MGGIARGTGMQAELTDTHAHLDFPEFSEQLPLVLDRARQAGVNRIITIGISVESSLKAAELAARNDRIYATVGIHPHEASKLDSGAVEALESIARRERVVAVGEIGLDYYRDRQPRDVQRECFCRQIEMACRIGKPAVFHVRDAYEDFLRIVPDYAARLAGAVMHCFSGDWAVAKRCLDLGFYLSIPGTVTFSNAETLRDVVKRAPADRLLLETDAPFLAPVPYRGKTNEPAFVLHTAKKVAELRGESLESVAATTTANALALFRIGEEAQDGGRP